MFFFMIFKTLGLWNLKLNPMKLLMAGFSIAKLVTILFDVLIKVDKSISPMDFVVLDCDVEL